MLEGGVEKGSVVGGLGSFSSSTLTSALGRWGFFCLQHDSLAPSGATDEGLEGSATTFRLAKYVQRLSDLSRQAK